MNHATTKSNLPLWLKITLCGLGFLLLLVLVFALALTVLRNSPDRLETVIERVASRVLQRELEIGELIEAELGRDTYLLARDVRLANPDWAEEADFVRAGRLLVRINLPSIWGDGPIIFDEIEASDVFVTVLVPEEHAPNWDFWPDETEEPEPEPPPGTDNKGSAVFPVLFRKGQINGGEVLYRDSDQHVVTSIDQLSIQETDLNVPFRFTLEGAVNEQPLEASGHIGPTTALLGQEPLDLDLAVKLGQLTVEGRGHIDDVTDLSGVDLHLTFASPHSQPLLDILGMSEVRDGPLNFEGHVTDAKPGLAIDMNGVLNEIKLRLSGTIADPVGVDGVDMGFELGGASMAEMGAMFDLAGLPEIPYEVSGEIHRDGSVLALSRGRLIAGQGRMAIEGRLPDFPGIDDWELEVEGGSFNLSLLGPLLGVNDLPAIPYEIKGKLESSDEGVELLDVRIENPNSSLSLKGVVGEAPEYFDSRMDLTLSGNSLASAGLWLGIKDLPNLKFHVTAPLSFSDTGWQLNDGVFSTPGLQLRLTGEVDSLPEPTSVRADAVLASQDLSATLKVYGFEQEGLPAFPVTISGELSGPPDALKLLEAVAESGDSKLTLSGVLSTQAGMDLAVSFASPDVLALLPAVAEGPLPPLPVKAGGKVSVSEAVVEIVSFEGLVGGAQLSLDGTLNLADPLEDSKLIVNAEGPDLGEVVGPWVQNENIAAVPFSLALDARFRAGGVEVKRLQAQVADTQLTGSVSIDRLEDMSGVRGAIQVAGPSSLNLVKTAGSDLTVPDAPYKLNLNFEKVGDRLRLQPLGLVWGESDIGGTVDLVLAEPPVIHADLHSNFVSLLVLVPDMEALEREEADRIAAGELFDEAILIEKLTTSELAERVIPGEPMDFGWLREVDASLKYQVDKVDLGNESSTRVAIDVAVKNGVFRTRELRWDGAFVTGDVELTLRALEEGAIADIYLDFERIPLLIMLGGEPELEPGSFYRARIKARGSSFQEFARTANGALVFKGGGGRLDNKGIDLILGDMFEEILDRINPFSNTDPSTQIVCHAAAASIKDGRVSVAPGLVLRTDKLDIASGGEINLQNERLNMAFNTRSRKGLGISASKAITPYFKIGGTMANPRLVLDAKGAAISGGAAVATAGLSILAEGLWDRWVATANNPCERLITELSKEDKKIFKDLLVAPGTHKGAS